MQRNTSISIIVATLLCLAPISCRGKNNPSLEEIAAKIDNGSGDLVEPGLLEMHRKKPEDAEVMALLARIEYLRSTEGLPQYRGMPPTGWDQQHMEIAESWALKAVKANPNHANALIVLGQIKYARYDLEGSLETLEKAERLDPLNEKLNLRKGATLRALVEFRGDPSLLSAAAESYTRVIKGPIDTGNERLAASELAEIHEKLGNYEKAYDYLTQSIATATGNSKAFLLDKRAMLQLFHGNDKAAIKDSQEALSILNFGVGRKNLATALLVSAGKAARDGDKLKASSLLAEMTRAGFSAEEVIDLVVNNKETFPAIYALLLEESRNQGGIEIASRALPRAGGFITAMDVKALHDLGIRFDQVDPRLGTILHSAIAYNNVEAVRALLENGADTRIRHPNGRSVLETTLMGNSPARKEIQNMVAKHLGAPKDWKAPGVEAPTEGDWYYVEKTFGLIEHQNKPLNAGQIVRSGGRCWFEDRPDFCFVFYAAPGDQFITLSLPPARLADLKYLRKTSAP